MPRAFLARLVLILMVTCTATLGWAAEAKPAIGRQIVNFTLQDFRGKAWSLDDFKTRKGVVVVFVGTECPIAAQYAARLQSLAATYAEAGVAFLAIDANQQDSLTELAHFVRVNNLEIPVLRDAGNKVADSFGAQRTPEAFLLDSQ